MTYSHFDEFKHNILFYVVSGWFIVWAFIAMNARYRLFNISTKGPANTDGSLYERTIKGVIGTMTNEKHMANLEHKMNSFNPIPRYFYLDSGIIKLMYSIREFATYSPPIYTHIIESLDKFLKYTQYIPHSGGDFYDNMVDLRKDILNSMEQMIFNISDDVSIKRLYSAIDSMKYILDFHLEIARADNNRRYKKTGPNTGNRYLSEDKTEGYNLAKSHMIGLEMF